MERYVSNNCIKSLKESGNPVVIYSLTEEAEAIAYACLDNGINVKAFKSRSKPK